MATNAAGSTRSQARDRFRACLPTRTFSRESEQGRCGAELSASPRGSCCRFTRRRPGLGFYHVCWLVGSLHALELLFRWCPALLRTKCLVRDDATPYLIGAPGTLILLPIVISLPSKVTRRPRPFPVNSGDYAIAPVALLAAPRLSFMATFNLSLAS